MMQTTPAVEFVTTLFRILKLAGMHDLQNAASQSALERAAATFGRLTLSDDAFFTALFANETVYINGQPLNAERQIYDHAIEAGGILAAIGVNEITIRRNVRREDLELLLIQIASRKPIGTNSAEIHGTIRVRNIDPETILGAEEDELPLEEEVLSTYASACVLARRFDEGVRKGDLSVQRHLKRIAQRLVVLSKSAPHIFLAIALSPMGRNPGKRRVHTAVIGILAGRVVSDDRHVLMRIAYVLLTQDIGLPRVAGMYREDGFGSDIVPRPNATMRARIPDSNVVMLLQSGRASPLAVYRARASYEAHWLGFLNELGWPYRGKLQPDADTVLIASARRLADAIWEGSEPDAAVAATRDGVQGGVNTAGAYLVFAALGIFPAGTPVMLASGGLGVVLSAGRAFADLNPTVLVLMDARARLVQPSEITLGASGSPGIDCVLHQCPNALTQAYEEEMRRREAASRTKRKTALTLPPVPSPTDEFGTLTLDRNVEELPEFSG